MSAAVISAKGARNIRIYLANRKKALRRLVDSHRFQFRNVAKAAAVVRRLAFHLRKSGNRISGPNRSISFHFRY
jgi:hypothetical protein